MYCKRFHVPYQILVVFCDIILASIPNMFLFLLKGRKKRKHTLSILHRPTAYTEHYSIRLTRAPQ